MPDLDLSALLSTVAGGAAAWAAVKVEIKFLWRDIRDLKKQAAKFQEKIDALEKVINSLV